MTLIAQDSLVQYNTTINNNFYLYTMKSLKLRARGVVYKKKGTTLKLQSIKNWNSRIVLKIKFQIPSYPKIYNWNQYNKKIVFPMHAALRQLNINVQIPYK